MRIGYKHIKSSWANRERIVSHLARGTAHQCAKFTAAYLSVAHVCANRSEPWRKPLVRRRSEALSRAEGHFFISLTHALFLRKTWDSFQFLQGGHFNPITQSWHCIAKRVFSHFGPTRESGFRANFFQTAEKMARRVFRIVLPKLLYSIFYVLILRNSNFYLSSW